MDFNINDKVRVKLTDFGRRSLMGMHFKLWGSTADYTPPKEDADGWSEWQLWHLMQELGSLCRMGGTLPFEMTIQLVERK